VIASRSGYEGRSETPRWVAVLLESFPEAERDTADDHNHHEDDERHAKQKAKRRGRLAAGEKFAMRLRLGHTSPLPGFEGRKNLESYASRASTLR
jgi:hypothetical protein